MAPEKEKGHSMMGRLVMAAVVAMGVGGCAGERAQAERVAAMPAVAAGTNEPGRRVAFYGLEATGARGVVYVLDNSGSMLDAFDFLRQELLASVGELSPGQEFAVVMFSDIEVNAIDPPQNRLTAATAERKKGFRTWVERVQSQGSGDDRPPHAEAIKAALAMRPQVVFFLTDGTFEPSLPDAVRGMNAECRAKIHTLAFVKIAPECAAGLQRIARENRGTYRFVAEKDLGQPRNAGGVEPAK